MRATRAGTVMLGGWLAAATVGAAHAEKPAVIGWTERVVLRLAASTGTVAGPTLAAKIDTGAETSSLDARDIAPFDRQGAEWVRFGVVDAGGKLWPVEAEVVRTVRIRRAGAKLQSRVVVRLELCVAGRSDAAEFTLADRRGQETSVLVGRAFLAGRFLVDSAATDTAPDACGR